MNIKGITLLGAGLIVSCLSSAQITLSQTECREMALKSNEELQKSGLAHQQAKLDKAIAFTSYLPDFSASGMVVYMPKNIDVMTNQMQIHGTYMAGISLMQPLYTGGKIIAGNKMAKIGIECSQEMLRKTRMDVICEADKAYWTYVVVNEKIKLLESYRKQLDTLHAQMQSNIRVQMATQNDLLRIEAKRSQIVYQLEKAKNGGDLCLFSLCNVVGIELGTPIIATDTVIAVSVPVNLADDISSRPELKLLEKQVYIQKQQVKSTRADFLPSLALMAQYYDFGNMKLKGIADDGVGGQIPYTQNVHDNGSFFMLSLNVPLFHWGEGQKKVKRAKLQVQSSLLDLQQNKRLLTIELRQAIQNLTDGYRLVQTAEVGFKQAEENLRVMNKRFYVDMCSLTDLLDAQTLWQEARSNQIEARTQYKLYESDYLRAAGLL